MLGIAAVQLICLQAQVAMSLMPSVTKVLYRNTGVYCAALPVHQTFFHEESILFCIDATQEQYHINTAQNDDPSLTSIPNSLYQEANLLKMFSYPHCYDPHSIAKLAASQLRDQLTRMDKFLPKNDYDAVGEMMGVLVVQYAHDNNHHDLGYPKAYSGTLHSGTCPLNEEDEFCLLVYDRYERNGFYKQGEKS